MRTNVQNGVPRRCDAICPTAKPFKFYFESIVLWSSRFKSFVQNGGAVFSIDGVGVGDGMAQFLKKALRIEGPQLTQKTITIRYEIRRIEGPQLTQKTITLRYEIRHIGGPQLTQKTITIRYEIRHIEGPQLAKNTNYSTSGTDLYTDLFPYPQI
jgi:hypothetical protein